MNRKGFTLIELLGVIIVLAIVLAIAVPSISNAYKNSKLKSEEIFVERLSDVIDSYVKLNSSNISFTSYGEATKEGETGTVDIYIGKKENNQNITIGDIINDNLLRKSDYVNAGNKDYIDPETKIKGCNTSAPIEVYRDSDYVYCYKVSKYELNCLTDEYREKLKIPATETTEAIDIVYAIDTCVWSR